MDELIRQALVIEEETAQEVGALGYTARLFAQTSLPYRDPGNVIAWGRHNGSLSLSVTPGTCLDTHTNEWRSLGYPYGTIPRLILAWIATEAVRTKDPVLMVGDSMSAFMGELGLIPAGGRWGTIHRLREQMKRLLGASISCMYNENDGFGLERVTIATKAVLWWDPQRPAQESLLPSYVQLSTEFFNELVSKPVPIDMRVLKKLKRSPLRLDIYTWLTYRMSYLRQPVHVPWNLLRLQFGSTLADTRSGRARFRQHFEKQLEEVLGSYRDANVQTSTEGILLLPSRPHVSPKGNRQLRLPLTPPRSGAASGRSSQ